MLYENGEPWWPDPNFERRNIKPEQEARYETDAWEEVIAPWVGDKDRVTVFEVAYEALKFNTPNIGTADQRRIIAILVQLGWRRSEKRDSRGRQLYIRC